MSICVHPWFRYLPQIIMNAGQHILIFLVRVYRWTLSPVLTVLFGPNGGCRYTPTCSQYTLQSIQTHGAILGSWLGVKRICRCNPMGGCGHDPVLTGSARVSRAEFGVSPNSRKSNIFLKLSEGQNLRRDASNCTPEAYAPHFKLKSHSSKFKTAFHGS